MSIENRIRSKLQAHLNPIRLEILNESHKHKGHGGYHPSGESHFHVTIVSAAFEGQPRVARHRSVYALLDDEFRDGLHALALVTLTPAEAASL